jgi:hypothetical protein
MFCVHLMLQFAFKALIVAISSSEWFVVLHGFRVRRKAVMIP